MKKERENPFVVPEGYFEEMADRWSAFADAQDKPVSWWVKSKSYLYMAAMFIGVVVIGYAFVSLQQEISTPAVQVTSNVTAEDYYDTLINSGVSEDLLVEYIIASNTDSNK